jgi:hypothetical protein
MGSKLHWCYLTKVSELNYSVVEIATAEFKSYKLLVLMKLR